MRQNGNKTAAAATNRRDRLIKERIHDPYHVRQKPAEGTACAECGLVFKNGAWRRNDAAAGAVTASCPACQRIRDRMPAGTVTLSGAFLSGHREEILNLARRAAEREGETHPLHRIMQTDETGEDIVITTTDIHLPRLIGQSLQKAYKGDLKIDYGADAYSVRVDWSREA